MKYIWHKVKSLFTKNKIHPAYIASNFEELERKAKNKESMVTFYQKTPTTNEVKE